MVEKNTSITQHRTNSDPIKKVLVLVAVIFVVIALGVVGYTAYQNNRLEKVAQRLTAKTETLPTAPPSTLWKSKDTLFKITADKPTEIVVMEDQFLNFYSLEGKLSRSVPLEYGAHIDPYGLKPSPDGQRLAFSGASKNTPKEYIENISKPGSGGVPCKDIFIYERGTNKISRLSGYLTSPSDKANGGNFSSCYGGFQWGPDSDTFIYTSRNTEKGESYIGIGKLSTGKVSKIRDLGSKPEITKIIDFSPSGQKISASISGKGWLKGVVIIDIEGRILREYTHDEFPISGVETEAHFEVYWGPTDDQMFLRVMPELPTPKVSTRHPTYLVYALDPEDIVTLRRLTPEKEGRTFSNILSIDGYSNRIAQEHFNSEDEQEHADIAILNWNGELITDSVKKIIADNLGREVRIPYSPHTMLYKDYVLTHITEGLILVNIKDRTAVEVEGDRFWYIPGVLLP